MNTTTLEQQLIRHEGWRNRPYEDSVGVITIGVGHNLEAKPVSDELIMLWLKDDIAEAVSSLFDQHFWVASIDVVRREVFINMVFNLGIRRFSGFRKMLKAAKEGDWEEASRQALDSKWASQVGGRATELAEQLRTGKRA